MCPASAGSSPLNEAKQEELMLRNLMAAAVIALAAPAAHAQTFPDKPIHLIVPFTPGSATDVVARAVAQAMSTKLGQPVLVENKPGAGGTIGSAQVAKSAPDGYTLLVNSSAHTVNPAIYTNLTYDTAKDLIGVTLLAELPNVLVVSPSRGWKTVGDVVKYAKDNPGKLNYASAGTGSGTHMNAEKFRLSAGFEGQHVPYRGTPEAIGDTMNGRVDYYFAPVIASLSLIREGRLMAMAVGGPKRSSVLPDVPTTEEAGFKGSAYNFWVGVLAPVGTPPAVIERLNKEFATALASPEVKERLGALGADPSPTTPADFDKMIARELVENADIAKRAGIKVQ
jgi:tripartite-type tricarboxylate transporter receptor subunit TctC